VGNLISAVMQGRPARFFRRGFQGRHSQHRTATYQKDLDESKRPIAQCRLKLWRKMIDPRFTVFTGQGLLEGLAKKKFFERNLIFYWTNR